jgi:hypothetical protein
MAATTAAAALVVLIALSMLIYLPAMLTNTGSSILAVAAEVKNTSSATLPLPHARVNDMQHALYDAFASLQLAHGIAQTRHKHARTSSTNMPPSAYTTRIANMDACNNAAGTAKQNKTTAASSSLSADSLFSWDLVYIGCMFGCRRNGNNVSAGSRSSVLFNNVSDACSYMTARSTANSDDEQQSDMFPSALVTNYLTVVSIAPFCSKLSSLHDNTSGVFSPADALLQTPMGKLYVVS